MKILYVTTISLTMNSFFKPHIHMLVNEGHQVDIACNYNDLALDDLYTELGCNMFQIDFSRSPLSFDNIRGYRQLKKVVEKGKYDIVHCHTPNASVITRLVCQKFRKINELKVFYTVHGFHFYKRAPKLNWMVYYPVELFCSCFTDKLITINQEDYALAKKRFKAKEIHYVPGVGIDFSKFENVQINRNVKREEIRVPQEAILLLSVGELNDNKNHQIIIKALAELKDENIHYGIAGIGEKQEFLLDLAKELGVHEQVHLLGYRNDIEEIYAISDIFCFPSFREGLPASLMEAMASSLPVLCSDIRGNNDLIDEKGGKLFDPFNEKHCKKNLSALISADIKKLGEYNSYKVKEFGVEAVLKKMEGIYFEKKYK